MSPRFGVGEHLVDRRGDGHQDRCSIPLDSFGDGERASSGPGKRTVDAPTEKGKKRLEPVAYPK